MSVSRKGTFTLIRKELSELIMNYYLVDYENVNVAGLNGVSKLIENDFVIIFYSENAETLTFGMHRRINESKADIKFQKVAVKEKNALDFQLCSYLGFLIRDTMTEKDSENSYFIVSNDKGYSVLPDYWKKFGVDLKIVSNLAKDEVKKIEVKLPLQNDKVSDLEKELSKILKDKNELAEAVNIINNAKTKVEVNSKLGKKFHQRAGVIYKAAKAFIADKKSS